MLMMLTAGALMMAILMVMVGGANRQSNSGVQGGKKRAGANTG
jgi:hypothetical protein